MGFTFCFEYQFRIIKKRLELKYSIKLTKNFKGSHLMSSTWAGFLFAVFQTILLWGTRATEKWRTKIVISSKYTPVLDYNKQWAKTLITKLFI